MIPTLTTLAVLFLAAAAFAAGKPGGGETFHISHASFPAPGVMSAGQPTGEQVQLLAEEGYKTIVDLRAPEEPRGFDEPEAARQNGLAYVNVPVTPAFDQTAIDRFLETMKKVEHPVIIHCATANRVGALWYAWLVLDQGLPPAAALAKARAAGLQNPELTAKIEKLVAERRPGTK